MTALALAAAALLAAPVALASTAAQQALATSFAHLKSTAGVDALAVTATSSGGANYGTTAAFGTAVSSPFWLNTAVRAAPLAETLLGAAVEELRSNLPQTGVAIGSVALVFTDGTAVTLDMLLTHTSGLAGLALDATAPTDLSAFLTTSLLAGSSVKAGIFAANRNYNRQDINIAIVEHLIDTAIAATPSLVASATKTAQAYIREKFLTPLGMSSAFFIGADGKKPTLTYPATSELFVVSPGALVAEPATVRYPGLIAAGRLYASAEDVGRLAFALFNGGLKSTIGTNMMALAVTAATMTNAPAGVTAQGRGIQFFSGSSVCAAVMATGAVQRCQISSLRLWGIVAPGTSGQLGVLCTTYNGAVTCGTSAAAQASTGTASSDVSFKAAGLALVLAVDPTATEKSTAAGVATSTRSNAFGLYVALCTMAVLVFVIVAAYLTEYVVQPAAPSAGVPIPGMAPPPMGGADVMGPPGAYEGD